MNLRHSRSLRKVAGGALALGIAALPVSGMVLTGSATATPGNPGTPGAPKVVFSEGFGTGLSSGQLSKIDTYDGGKYDADPAWKNEAAGNGLIVDGNTTDATMLAGGFTAVGTSNGAGGTHGTELRLLATALGTLNGTSPAANNHVVAAYTDADPGANAIEFKVKSPLSLDADGRFLTISANVAAENCVKASDPELKFYLVDAGTENAVNDTALDPCDKATDDGPFATTLTGGNAILFNGDQVGIVLRNENGSGGGNDHAYDDIKVLDVTPQLDKTFEDSGDLAPGDTSNLVFTVTNTSELGEKKGWSFTDKLTKGLTVAGDPTTDCTADVAAAVGDTSIAVTNGDLADGATSCTITVPVTSDKDGTYENGPGNITSTGLDKPGTAQVTFTSPTPPTEPNPTLPETGAAASGHGDAWLFGGGAALAGLGLLTVVVAARRKRTAA